MPPLICFPPGGGVSWCYAPLVHAINAGRPVYGLQSVGLAAEEQPLSSMNAIADEFLALVREIQPHGPYHLLGWSLGGLVAHEVACRLLKQNERVALLANIDAYPMPDAENVPELDRSAVIEEFANLFGLDPRDFEGKTLDIPIILETARRSGHILGELDLEQLQRIIQLTHHHALLLPGFHPHHFDGDMLLVRASERVSPMARPDLWKEYVEGRIETFEVNSTHARLMDPVPAEIIGREINRRLDPTDTPTGNALAV